MMVPSAQARWRRLGALAAAIATARLVAPWWSGRDASAWLDGDRALTGPLAAELVAFEQSDDLARKVPVRDRFAGEWALVTHQMIALGLAQRVLAHPEDGPRLAPEITRAARKSSLARQHAG